MIETEKIIILELFCINLFLLMLCLLQSQKIKKKIGQIYSGFNTFIKRSIKGLIFYTLWLFPRKKNLILFGADAGNGFAGNPKYLFLEAQKYPEIETAWITKNHSVYTSMKKNGHTVYMYNSLKGIWLQLRAKNVVCSNCIKDDFLFWAVGGATVINCWHGVGLKQSWYRNVNAFSGKWKHAASSLRRAYHLWWARTNMGKHNYVIATSEEVAEYYPETYNVDAKYVLNLGQARNDVFFDDSLEDSSVPEFLKNNKTIVYMPTHRNYGRKNGKSEKEIGRNIDYTALDELLRKYGYTFVIKQHRWNTGERSLFETYENIIDISSSNYSIDSQLVLKYTDILITDYSSCYTDYLLLNRPVVFFCYDLEQYLSDWDLNFDYNYVTPGPKVYNSDQLLCELERLMQGQDEYSSERERVKRVFYSPENQNIVAPKQMEYILENIVAK